MKVAIVHHQYAKKGGMESYMLDLVAGFIDRGDKVTIFTYQGDKNLLTNPAVTVVRSHLAWFPKKYRKLYFAHRINKKFNKQDFDLSLNLMRTSSQDIAICGGTHRGFLAAMHKKPRFRDQLEIRCEQKSFDLSPHIIAHSSLLTTEITELYQTDPKKVHLIHPPVDTQKFHAGLRQQRDLYAKQFGIDNRSTHLLFPSTGHKRKGLFELLAALATLPEAEFTLLVAGQPLKNTAIPKNVRYLGYVNNIAELYTAVDFVILPSHYEPFGLVAMESLQCGTPVILSDRVGAKDLITDNEGVIFSGDINAENIAQAIKTACSKKFNIAENFAQRKGLTIAAHIEKIVALVK